MAPPLGRPNRPSGKDWVALTLAAGIVVALTLITVGVVYDAIASQGPGLSENATQILTGAFGGIIGVLGSYIGYRAGTDRRDNGEPPAGGDDQSGAGHISAPEE